MATLEMDFTVVVYTKEGTNRFLGVLSLAATWLLRPSDEEGTDVIGPPKRFNRCEEIRSNAAISATRYPSYVLCFVLDLNNNTPAKSFGKAVITLIACKAVSEALRLQL